MTDYDVADIGQIFRQEYGRAVASLVRYLGDIDLAEEAIAEAFAIAVQRWPSSGLPPSPAGWIITTGRNRAIDWLRPVLAVIYLVFNEGYTASSGEALVREHLCAEAIRLARILADLMPDEPEVLGLLALLLLTDSRRTARTGPNGELVLLAEQDRTRWNRELIAEGQALVRVCLRRNRPGPYQIQAAINAVHADAATAADTDWRQILALYDQLIAVAPTPVVALNRAIALAELDGPGPALALLDGLDLQHYQHFHATRADLLRRLGRRREAADAYEAALAMTQNAAERAFLQRRRDEMDRA